MTGRGKDFATYLEETAEQAKIRTDAEVAKLAETEKTKRSRYELRRARQETWRFAAGCLAAVAGLSAVTAAIYFGTTGPEDTSPTSEERRETACTEGGGGWVPEDLLASTDQGMCVYPPGGAR